MVDSPTESKELTVRLAHRQGMFERRSAFGQRITDRVLEAVAAERAAGWELDEPVDFDSLRRADRIEWRTSFSFNPLGDMNKAISATIRLRREGTT